MDAFYSRFFPGERSDAQQLLHEVIQTHLTPTSRLLDFGCGDNRELEHYRTATRQVWGVDLQAHPDLGHSAWFRLFASDGQAPFPDASFDVISSAWVLEHVRSPERFLGEMGRLLKPGGVAVVLSINSLHYVTLLSRLLSLVPHGWTQWIVQRLYGRPSHDTFPTFYRLNTRATVQRQANNAGFELLDWHAVANPDYFSFSPRLRRGAIVTDWLLSQISPDLGRLYFVTTLRKSTMATTPILQPSAA